MAKKNAKKKEEPTAKTPIKLDIACGENKREGFLGVDIAPIPQVDIVHNLSNYPWPFEDNSVSEAHCSHYIEHIPMAFWNPGNEYTIVMQDHQSVDALCKFWNELYRILTPGGKATIIAPYYSHQRCWQDPTHRRPICDAALYYLSQDWLKMNKLAHYNLTCNFEAVWGYGFEQDLLTRNDEYRQHAVRHFVNAVQDIHITLTKK